MRETTLQTKVSEEGGGRDSPAARGEDHGEAGCPLQPREVHGGADLHLQPGEDPTPEQGDARRRLGPRGKPALEQVFWQDL